LDLASGPCRELRELFDSGAPEMLDVEVDCYDFDANAIDYARQLLGHRKEVQFFIKNAIRMALKKNLAAEIPNRYDVIFCTGLFDYLDQRVAIRLVSNLRTLLKDGGVLCVSNYWEKDKNPWAHLMEWVVEWNLIYRTKEEFLDVFLGGGFREGDLKMAHEPLKIMQYCLARRS
jgi:extracellular factor (EF) 3-hydroxypalmitic acid methyl ester biosynthesis protein